jgi:Kef-type K+ transport system membrane component KefB
MVTLDHSESSAMEPHYHPLLFIALVAVLAPLFNELPLRLRIPNVVLEIAGGIIIGPQVLGLVRPEGPVELLGRAGMCFLFLLAGMEIDFGRLRGRPLTLASGGWLLSFGIALGTAYSLRALGLDLPPLLVALALTTTAIGTLLPILRDSGELSRDFGMMTLAAGAMGEFGPLLLLSIIPAEGHSTTVQALLIAGFVLVAIVAARLVFRVQTPWFAQMLRRHFHKTSQLPVRLALLLVTVLSVVAVEMGLEILIGAFAAGMIIGMVTHGDEVDPFLHKLDGVGFGFLIPIFFVLAGVRFDLKALLGSSTSLLCVPLFLTLFLLARGLPVLLYRHQLAGRDQLALSFYSATALPVVVAITEVGLHTRRMTPQIAAALVGAGMISLLVYPPLAMALRSRVGRHQEEVVPPTPASAGASEKPYVAPVNTEATGGALDKAQMNG